MYSCRPPLAVDPLSLSATFACSPLGPPSTPGPSVSGNHTPRSNTKRTTNKRRPPDIQAPTQRNRTKLSRSTPAAPYLLSIPIYHRIRLCRRLHQAILPPTHTRTDCLPVR